MFNNGTDKGVGEVVVIRFLEFNGLYMIDVFFFLYYSVEVSGLG